MDNIIKANAKKEHILKTTGNLGFTTFVIIGIIGCSVMESNGGTFGWSFVVIGILISFFMTCLSYILEENGGALTTRKLFEGDLRGLSKAELERLRLHIYAKHGYNFNVNDGLYYLDKIAQKHFPNYRNFKTLSELKTLSNAIGYDNFFILASNNYNFYSSKRIEDMSEKEKNNVRKIIEESNYAILDEETSDWFTYEIRVGYFNRIGKFGHEGRHYYDFEKCDWYKPTTSNIEEVYNNMSNIEKYNIEFIKAYEARMK